MTDSNDHDKNKYINYLLNLEEENYDKNFEEKGHLVDNIHIENTNLENQN